MGGGGFRVGVQWSSSGWPGVARAGSSWAFGPGVQEEIVCALLAPRRWGNVFSCWYAAVWTVIVQLTSSALALWRPSHAGAGTLHIQSSHKGFTKQ